MRRSCAYLVIAGLLFVQGLVLFAVNGWMGLPRQILTEDDAITVSYAATIRKTIWDPASIWWLVVVDGLWGRVLTDCLRCPGLPMRSYHDNCIGRIGKPRRPIEPAVRNRTVGDVTVILRKRCPSFMEEATVDLVKAMSWKSSPPSARLPPDGNWSAYRTRRLASLIKDVAGILEKLNIDYYLAAGSLLGIARHGTLIPWDTKDIDIVLIDRTGGSQKRQFLEAVYQANYAMRCNKGGKWLWILRDDVSYCDSPKLFPKLDVFTAFQVPGSSLFWLHQVPAMHVVPVASVYPLRLAVVFRHDGEIITLLRPALDGVLDCSLKFRTQKVMHNLSFGGADGSSVESGSVVKFTWRDLCYYDDHTINGGYDLCSRTQTSFAFTSSAEISFAEFVRRYAPDSNVSQYLFGQTMPTINLAWQRYLGDVVAFRLDFVAGHKDCAVLVDAPLTSPVPVGGVDVPSLFSWDRYPDFECQRAE